jgi:hypothetical protein
MRLDKLFLPKDLPVKERDGGKEINQQNWIQKSENSRLEQRQTPDRPDCG